MSEEPPVGTCARTALLLSLRADGAATPSQLAEIDAHLPGCDACRRCAAVDVAVHGRLAELAADADVATFPWLDGFARRTASRAVFLAREARAQNRLLWMSAAAAALVAATAQFVDPGRSASPAPNVESASIREAARSAVMRLPRLSAYEGK